MRRLQKSEQSGFTLVEIVVVIVVAGIMMVGVSNTVVGIRLINARAKDAAIVNSLVEDKIEELRSSTFVALEDGTYDFTDELPNTITEDRSAEYTVAAVSGSPGLKEITVTVSYNDLNNDKVYQYQTIIGELGVGQY